LRRTASFDCHAGYWGWPYRYYIDANSVFYGFLRTPDGKLTTLKAPSSGTTVGSFQGTDANAINDFGEITGNVEDDNDLYHGFLYRPDGHYQVFDVAGAGTMANQGTVPTSINLEGAISGYYVDSTYTLHGFLRHADGTLKTFDPVGSVYTYPCQETCINIDGQITGFFADAAGVVHGFLRDPDGKMTTIDGPEAGTAPNTGTFAASERRQRETPRSSARSSRRRRRSKYRGRSRCRVLGANRRCNETIPLSGYRPDVFGALRRIVQCLADLIHAEVDAVVDFNVNAVSPKASADFFAGDDLTGASGQ
jgi:hypothetical protein